MESAGYKNGALVRNEYAGLRVFYSGERRKLHFSGVRNMSAVVTGIRGIYCYANFEIRQSGKSATPVYIIWEIGYLDWNGNSQTWYDAVKYWKGSQRSHRDR